MKSSVTFLIDCNNFFVSCERVFKPELRDKPVVVLSSNDGCIVARSNEVRSAGIAMGIPYFQIRAECEKMGVRIFSSNFRLYGDMSDRVMSIMHQFCDDVDVYSIDEAFLTFPMSENRSPTWGSQWCEYVKLAHEIQSRVWQWTGMPISIGIAPSKTLAKVASKIAKKHDGVCSLLDETIRPKILDQVQVGEVWNIGRSHTKRLVGNGILTAQQFVELPDHWLKSHMGVMGLRIAAELRGMSCFEHQAVPVSRKSIMCSRSFGEAIMKKEILKQATAHHVTTAASKMRRQDCKATWLRAYAYTKEKGIDYRDKASGWHEFHFPTDDTGTLIHAASSIVDRFFTPGLRYVKAGVLLADFVPKEIAPSMSLFETSDEDTKTEIMHAVDDINSYFGTNTVLPAAALKTTNAWSAKRDLVTPEYTTSWQGILKAQ